jgi:hypothetical protein
LFLSDLKGTIFYGVPHAGGEEAFKKYLGWQCKQIIAANMSKIKKSGLLKNVKSFDRQMVQLSVDFRLAVTDSLNIYAFGEGLPLEPGVAFDLETLAILTPLQQNILASKPVCMLSILALKFPKVLIMGYEDVCKKELGARSPYVPFSFSTSLVICNITYDCFCGCDQF